MPRYDSGNAKGCSMPIHLCGSICVWFYVLGLQIWTWFLWFAFTDPINTTLVPINTTHPSSDLHRRAWFFYLIVNIFDSFYLQVWQLSLLNFFIRLDCCVFGKNICCFSLNFDKFETLWLSIIRVTMLFFSCCFSHDVPMTVIGKTNIYTVLFQSIVIL